MKILLAALACTIGVAAGETRRAARADPAEATLRRLAPGAEACAALAALAREARRVDEERGAEEARLLPGFLEALRRMRAEVEADRGLAKETMEAASLRNSQRKECRAAALRRLAAIEARARSILGDEACRRAGFAEPGAPRAGEGREAGRLRREIARIHAEQQGSIGALGRWLLAPGVAEALERFGGHASGRPAPRKPAADPAPPPGEAEVAALRREINLWNLLNGLHLTASQLATIAAEAGSRAPDAARVVATLSPEQRAVLADYKACLVPPRNLRDPVRAGQANDPRWGERLLARLRTLPPDRFAREGGRRMFDALREIEAKEGTLTDLERCACLLLLAETAREARSLDDATFALRAPGLAARLEPLRKLESLRREMKEALGPDRVALRNAERFLLDPAIAPLCRRRMERLAHGPPVEPPAEVPKAERCDGGSACGRP